MKIVHWTLAIVLVTSFGVLSFAADDHSGSWQGWIADENCAKNYSKEPSASHSGCGKGCVGKGARWALATSDGHFILDLGETAATDHLGSEVVVRGTLSDDTIQVASISEAN